MGTYLFTELAQDMGDLTGFGETQFADVVLEGDDFGRLDEDCLAGRGFVIDKAGKLAFAAGFGIDLPIGKNFRVTADIPDVIRRLLQDLI